jgi:hypothetical protein
MTNTRCGFIPPTPCYAPCTREWGHSGPCAHPFAEPPKPRWGAIIGWCLLILAALAGVFAVLSNAKAATLPPALAVYRQPAADAKKWADRGVTIAVCYEPGGATMAQWEAAYVSAGIKVIREPSGNAAADDADPNLIAVLWGTQEIDNLIVSAHDQAVAAGQDPKAAEEGQYKGMEGWAAFARQQFPHKKLACVIGLEQFRWNKADYKRIAKCFDYLIVDWYPVHRGAKVADLLSLLQKFKADVAGDKLFAVCVECSLQHLSPAAYPNQRAPTAQELTDELNACLTVGAMPCLFPQQIGEDGAGFKYEAMTADLVTAEKSWVLINTVTTPTPTTQATQPITSPTANPAVATSQPTWIVDGVSIPAPRASRRARIICDVNPSPVVGPNPRWKGPNDPDAAGQPRWVSQTDGHDYMVSLGYEEGYMIYNGTLNLARTWGQYDGFWNLQYDQWNRPKLNPNVDGHNLDYSLVSGNKDRNGNVRPRYDDPPDQLACQLAGRLADDPGTYGAKTAKPHLPIMIDLEGGAAFSLPDNPTLVQKQAYLTTCINTVKWIKQGDRQEQEVWWYFFHAVPAGIFKDKFEAADPSLRDLWEQLCSQLTGYAGSHYYTDYLADNPDQWLPMCQAFEVSLRRFAPQYIAGPKIAVLTPTFAIYAPANDKPYAQKLNGKPVPFDCWCNQVTWLVEHDYTIWLWFGDGTLDAGVRPHLAFLSLHGMRPAGDAAAYLQALSQQNYRSN